MKRIASITPIYNNEYLIRPHFKMLADLDVNIVILGKKPWPEYKQVYGIKDVHDSSETILRTEFPHVHIITTEVNEFGADLLNPGVELAKQLGCDGVLKLDVDMILDSKDWKRLKERLYQPFESLALQYRKCTFCYFKDLDHGCPGETFIGLGSDIIALNTAHRFVENLHCTTDIREEIAWDDFMVHHLVGFKPGVDDVWVENQRKKFNITWQSAPDSIKKLYENKHNNTFN